MATHECPQGDKVFTCGAVVVGWPSAWRKKNNKTIQVAGNVMGKKKIEFADSNQMKN